MAIRETTIKEIKAQIVTAIKDQKNMNVLEYSKTEEVLKLLGDKAALHLSTYLSESDKTSVSYPVLEKLWLALNVPGVLKRDTKKEIKVTTILTVTDSAKTKAPAKRKVA
jgi:hypothetical protein